jgi:hypothetical protein
VLDAIAEAGSGTDPECEQVLISVCNDTDAIYRLFQLTLLSQVDSVLPGLDC